MVKIVLNRLRFSFNHIKGYLVSKEKKKLFGTMSSRHQISTE